MSRERSKKKDSKTFLDKEMEKMSSLDKAQVNELLAESISNYVSKVKKEAKNTEEMVSLLNGYITEFLEAFILFGYDIKGSPICIHYAKNQKDADALNCLINKALFNRINE